MPRPEPEVAAANARRKSLERRLTIPPLTAAESNLLMAVMRVGLLVMFGDSEEVELRGSVRAARRIAAAEAREGLAQKLLQAIGDLPQEADHG